ncbi:MAG: beta strand repeat-containing protein, partial [Candidatus Thorarchaeota archaeon SMTZ1-45]
MTWDSVNSWFDLSVSQASVGLWTYFVNSSSQTSYGITSLDTNSLSVDVVWDQIVVQTTVADDTRVNANDNVEVRVTLWLAYDSSPLGAGDSVTLDGTAMTWDSGNSWFDLTVSQASVGLWTYFVNSSTDTNFGITALDLNSQSVDVIWDQIVVQTTVADDTRVSVGADAEIRVTLWLAYDSTPLGSGDTVTLAGQAMTWDSVNSWFDLTVSQASVGLWTYFVNSSTQASFGIIAIDTNSQSVGVVWDQIVVQTTVADDTRVNIGDTVEIRVTLWLAYDTTFLGSGDTVTLAGQAMTWDSVNSWFDLTVSQASVGLWTYHVNSSSDSTYGITALDTNGQSVGVVWDQIIVQTTTADDTRVNVGDIVEIRVTLWLAYDSTPLGSSDTVTLAGQVMTWDGGNSWFDLSVSQASIGLWRYFVNSSSESTYGITVLDTNGQSVDVIWDQIMVQTTVADDTRVNIGNNVEVRVTLWLAYDSTFLGAGDSVTLAGQAMTWDSGNSWFDLTVSQASVGLWTYFVNSSIETNFGITTLDTNGQSVGVVWDQIVVQTTVADSTRVNVDDNVEVRVTLWLAYDNTPLGSGDTVTLAGQAMTWDSGNSWFDLMVSQTSVGLWTYFVNSSAETIYGITTLDTNGQDVDIIWDQIVVQTTVADDTRVNVDDNVEVRVTLWLAYDSTPLGSGDTVTLAGQAMMWDAGNSWFDLTVSQASVGLWTYFVNSSTQTSFGITAIDTNSQSVGVVWDRIVVQTTVADDTRVNVDDNVEVRVTLWLAYDNTFLGAGDSVTLDGTAMTWDAGNSWFDLTVSQASVGLWTYFVNSSTETNFGITTLDTNGQSVGVIWDRIVVQTTVADDTRVNVGADAEIRVTLWLAYDTTFLGSGDTVTLAGQAMTWDSGNFWFDLLVSQASVGLWTYYVNSSTQTGFGITAIDTNSQSIGVIWDQIVVQTTIADDTRVNVGDNVEIRVTLWLAYDSTFLEAGNSVTLDGTAMAWDSVNSWFDLTVSQASVGLWTYFVNSSSDSTYGITALDTNGQSIDVIWDQIVVQTTVADDTRVNVGDNVEIRVTLWLAYDTTFLGSGDTVTLAGQAMTWDSGNSWFDLTVSHASVGLWRYYVNSSSEAIFGITVLDTNSQSIDVIWDRIVVQTTLADDTRVNMNDNVEIRVTLWLAYDNTFLGSGDSVTLAGQGMTWDAGNSWFDLTVSQASVGLWTYFVNSSTETNFGITTLDTNGQSVGVIWDRIVVQTTVADDTRVNVNDNVEVRVTLWLAYDSTPLGSGDTITLAGQAMTWDSINSWFDLTVSQASVGLWTYFVNSSSDSTYGITLLDTNSQSVDIIWDQIIVQTTVADDTRVNVGDNVEIHVTLWLAYDSTFLGSSDTVTLAGQAMTWDSGNSWFDLTVSQASVGLWTYFVNSSTQAGFGINAIDTNSQSVGVVWDEIVVQTTMADDTRVNIGTNVEVRVTLWLAYDSTFLGAGDSVTLDGTAMTWDSVNSWFDLTVSQASIGLWTYFVNSSTETNFGVTALDLNGQSVDVIWDQIIVQTTVADDTRINVGANAEVRVTLWLAYDSTPLGNGDTVTLAGQAMTWDGGNSWFELTVSQVSVGLWRYYVNSSTETTYGITVFDINSQTVDIIWDQIVVQTTVADDTRVNIGTNVEVRVSLWLAYDSTFLGAGDSVTLDGTAMTWDSGNSWFDLTVSQASVGLLTYFVNSSTQASFGITALDTNSQSIGIIWDQILVQTTIADDTRVNIGDNVEIRVTLWLAYDSTFLGAGDTVTLAGQAMTWDAVNSWFDLTVSQVSVGLWTYFVNSSSQASFGITSLNTNSQS